MALKVKFEGKELTWDTDDVSDAEELKTFVKGEDGKYKSNGTAKFVSWKYVRLFGDKWGTVYIDHKSYYLWLAYAEKFEVPTISESEICVGQEGLYLTTCTFTKPVLKKTE